MQQDGHLVLTAPNPLALASGVKMVSQAIKDSLARAYAQIRENGMVDIGLQSTLDVGVKEAL